MTSATAIEAEILEKLKNLSPQQQQQVRELIDFLQFKKEPSIIEETSEIPISALESAKELVGCLDSKQGNLSLRKKEFKRKILK